MQAETAQKLLPAHTPPIKFSIITVDVSFISLEFTLPKIKEFLQPNGTAVVLIKPQFELGRKVISKTKNAIITDPELQLAACQKVVECAEALGLSISEPTPSPVLGEHGNQEFLARVLRTSPRVGVDF
ncbi:MAG: hypothetical protein LBP35_02455 [Candidatus Ancillula trichonymphae]|nr:hypothetical protein [Candidatus Ancillula trichonymphae]